MGVVWRARDQLLDRDVAIKEVVLTAALGEAEQANAYQRTRREAQTAARLSHRGVVTVFDVAEEDDRPWIVMELVPSRSLDQVLASDGPLTPLHAGRIGQQLLAALAAAHAAGVLHRDVKPSNVLIASDGLDERAVLTDFGIAQFEGDPRLTQTGMVMGSPGFTAPERIRGGDATPASDLWSLGATIYAAVEGHGPYEQRGGPITTMTAIINEDAPQAPSGGPLSPLIAALLRREPSARPTAATAALMFSDVLPLLPDRRATRDDEGACAEAHAQDAPLAPVMACAPVVEATVAEATVAEPTVADVAMAEVAVAETVRKPGRRQRSGRGRLKIALAATAVLVAAAIGVTAALVTRNGSSPVSVPSSPAAAPGALPPLTATTPAVVQSIDKRMGIPPSYRRETIGGSAMSATAGFSIGLPPGWHPKRIARQRTFLFAPNRLSYVDIDLTTHTRSNMMAEARFVEKQALSEGHFPGYQLIRILPANIRGTLGAVWEFDWVNPQGVTMRVDDLLFTLRTASGPQSYAIYSTGPAGRDDNDWNRVTLPVVTRMLHTFKPVP
jgi:hypothetical protein